MLSSSSPHQPVASMMDCRTVESCVSLLLDGELDAKTQWMVEIHLRRCACCQAQRDRLAHIKACLGQQQPVTAPEDFTQCLQSRLRSLEKEQLLESCRRHVLLRRGFFAAGILGLILLAGIQLLILFAGGSRSSHDVENGRAATQPVLKSGSGETVAEAGLYPAYVFPALKNSGLDFGHGMGERLTSDAQDLPMPKTGKTENDEERFWTRAVY